MYHIRKGTPMKKHSEKAFFDAFIDLMKEKSFDEISASKIIQKSGYSRSSFYRNYEDKFDFAGCLVKNAARMYARELAESMIRYYDKEDFLYHYSLNMLNFIYHNRDIYRLIFRSLVPGAGLNEFCDYVVKAFCDTGLFDLIADKSHISADFFYYCGTHQYIRFMVYWDMHHYSPDARVMARQIEYFSLNNKPFTLLTKADQTLDGVQI